MISVRQILVGLGLAFTAYLAAPRAVVDGRPGSPARSCRSPPSCCTSSRPGCASSGSGDARRPRVRTAPTSDRCRRRSRTDTSVLGSVYSRSRRRPSCRRAIAVAVGPGRAHRALRHLVPRRYRRAHDDRHGRAGALDRVDRHRRPAVASMAWMGPLSALGLGLVGSIIWVVVAQLMVLSRSTAPRATPRRLTISCSAPPPAGRPRRPSGSASAACRCSGRSPSPAPCSPRRSRRAARSTRRSARGAARRGTAPRRDARPAPARRRGARRDRRGAPPRERPSPCSTRADSTARRGGARLIRTRARRDAEHLEVGPRHHPDLAAREHRGHRRGPLRRRRVTRTSTCGRRSRTPSWTPDDREPVGRRRATAWRRRAPAPDRAGPRIATFPSWRLDRR